MWVYNETEQAGQEEIQKVEFEEKRGTRECDVGAKAHAGTDKEGSYSKSNKGDGAPAQNSTQLIPPANSTQLIPPISLPKEEACRVFWS